MMKFGRNLPRNQVPEWSAEYVDYKGLKKLIKSTAEQGKHGDGVDLAETYFSLDRNLERVDAFYNKKAAEISRRLDRLFERHGLDVSAKYGLDKESVEDLLGALLEVRTQLRKLQWYGEVNRRAFVKITKKLDKKVPSAHAQQQYLEVKVEPKPFASSTGLVEKTKSVNDWLSQLSEYKPTDDSSSTHSTTSLSKVHQNNINIPKLTLDKIDLAIRNDDVSSLVSLIQDGENDDPQTPLQSAPILCYLLQRAISCRARECIKSILPKLHDLNEADDLNSRNCVHRLVIAIGRAKTAKAHRQDELSTQHLGLGNSIVPAEAPTILSSLKQGQEPELEDVLGNVDESVQLLQFLLNSLSQSQADALSAQDGYGRLPLHYAAQYGLVGICKMLIDCMRAWSLFDISNGLDATEWQDLDGTSPLHLAVLGGFPATTKALLDSCMKAQLDSANNAFRALSKDCNLLTLATTADFIKIVQDLVAAGADPNHQDDHGEAALHIASRRGRVECARAILASGGRPVEIDLTETVFGWSPLHVACVDGQPGMVDLLVGAGADVDKLDFSGWSPMEHAALRGHMDIAESLEKVTTKSRTPEPNKVEAKAAAPAAAKSLVDRKSGVGASEAKIPDPVKSFGHRYLTDECMVLVSLGSMDMRKHSDPVQLDNVPVAKAHATQLDTALSIVVSATGASGDSTSIDLPVQDSINTEPIAFTTKDVSKVKILFDLVPTYAGSKDRVIGRGVALLNSVKPTIGSKRMNLQGDISVPIIAAQTLDFIGTVNFNFLIITPFSHPNMSISQTTTYWRSLTSPVLIGHRGLGKNLASRKSLQLGENTIQSFIAAANLGASYVEFDVQLTKDLVPVIYHDFLVSETGTDAPVHTLTLEQFLNVNDSATPSISPLPSPLHTGMPGTPTGRMHRAQSLGASARTTSPLREERMKHTRNYKLKGFKGNSRGRTVQAPFATLHEMFEKIPENIGFNIEMKYPMLLESEQEDMDTYAVELNSFVDTVLDKVYDCAKNRDIIFSSFHPDVCLLLSLKQPSIPVLFLTDAGTSEVSDVRASSLQEAIRFASRWNLLGVVTNSTPLVLCPRLVRVIKESGLVCVSYGALNNEPANVKLQIKEGLDAVIVDSVLAIRKGLTHTDAQEGEVVNETSIANGAATLSVPYYRR